MWCQRNQVKRRKKTRKKTRKLQNHTYEVITIILAIIPIIIASLGNDLYKMNLEENDSDIEVKISNSDKKYVDIKKHK